MTAYNPDGSVKQGHVCPCCGDTVTSDEFDYHAPTLNTYECKCGACWENQWCCGVDDECPGCGMDISPVKSVTLYAKREGG